MRSFLLKQVLAALEQNGYEVLLYASSCFDIAAQKADQKLLIKVLSNVDGFKAEQAEELKKLCSCLGASPVLVGETVNGEKMRQGIMYERHEVPSVAPETFSESVRGNAPEAVYSKGRDTVEIDAKKLREAREQTGLSLEQLASKLGVSRETIYLYEQGKMGARVETARRMERVLDADLVRPRQVFETLEKPADIPRTLVEKKLAGFDFDVFSFSKLNFDLLARDKKTRIILRENIPPDLNRMVVFSDFFKTLLAVISDKKSKHLPTFSRTEILETASKRALIELLEEHA